MCLLLAGQGAAHSQSYGRTMKYNKIFNTTFMALALGTALVGCSDWDDHYDSTIQGDAGLTIWQNIKSNENLSQFASLIEQAGYADVLNSSRTLTVWAPENGTFNYDSIKGLSQSDLINKFVKNHIANANYPASGSVNQVIHMLNNKVMTFAGSGTYTMDNLPVTSPNAPASNGVLHAISGYMAFNPNLFEGINAEVLPIDSFSTYFHQYDVEQLDENNSIPGPVVNGERTYLDSVMRLTNVLLDRYSMSPLNVEDSSYSIIVPNNEAWVKAKDKIKNYFKYNSTLRYHDALNDTRNALTDTVYTYNDVFLSDSLVYKSLMSSLAYNNNLYGQGGNRALLSFNGGELQTDSLVAASGSRKLYTEDAAYLFHNATPHLRSNGKMWVTDELRIRPWNSFAPVIKVEAESSNSLVPSNVISTYGSGSSRLKNPKVEGSVSDGYITYSNSENNFTIGFTLPGVVSTAYNIYVVTVPANYSDSTVTDERPNFFEAKLQYNTDRVIKNPKSKSETNVAVKSFGRSFTNDPTKVDTVFVGTHEFPVSYYGQTNVMPALTLTSRVTTSNLTKYTRDFRIDCVLLVPKELDDYLKEHPDYKYDKSDNRSFYIIYF